MHNPRLDGLNLTFLVCILLLEASLERGQAHGLGDHARAADTGRVRYRIIIVFLAHQWIVETLEASLERG